MTSTFMGLTIASRGLYSSQVSLSVISHNISNTDTEGYSRQTVNQTTVSPAIVYSGTAVIGAGSQINSIDRINDARLNEKYWRENGGLGEWEVKSDGLTELETVLGEPSDNAFSTVISNFYAALETLSKDTGDEAARTNVMETANSLCAYLNDAAERLQALREDVNTSVKTAVDQINSYSRQIADLNARIKNASAAGVDANDLEDQRDLLIDKLSKLAEVTVGETVVGKNPGGTDNKILTVSVNGVTLVNGNDSRQLECYETADGMYGIRWQDTGDSFQPGSGELQGYLDLRDGTGTSGSDSSYKGIPYYMSQLDNFARTFAKAFNEGIYADGNSYYSGHAGGYGADGSTGTRFFTCDGLSSADFLASGADIDACYANITAANISLSQDVKDDVDKIAAASSADEESNNENIDDLLALCQDSRMFNKGTPEDFMNSIISTLGTSSAYAQRLADNKSTMVKYISDSRSSVSGVSLNEETAELTKVQEVYNAAAKMVTVWNEIYATTIDMVNS